ncbi:MAG: efflux RND transporter periplasmic adaptor subunit [Candidatus Aminicenantales bacterium]
MKKIMIIIFVLLILVFILLSCQPPDKKQEAAEESFGATPVKAFKVRKQRISEKLHYTGIIQAWRSVNVTPDIGGKIAKIYVEEGEMVHKGQLLAELDTRAIRLQLEQAEASLAVAEANYKDAKRNMERLERLKSEKAVSDQQYEKVRLAYEAAEAQLQQAEASLNLARHNLDVSLMRAPFDGVVASKNAEVGDVINPMMGSFSPQSGVLTLMDFSRVKIEIDVSPQEIVRIKKGQTVLLKVDTYPDSVFKGEVAIVNLTADPSTKKFKVEARVENRNLLLKPNTFGEVTLEVSTHEETLVIPQRAVLENRIVFLARGNKAERREVTIGLQNAEMVEVLNGVEEGDLVIVEGNYGLEDGAEIAVKEVIQ